MRYTIYDVLTISYPHFWCALLIYVNLESVRNGKLANNQNAFEPRHQGNPIPQLNQIQWPHDDDDDDDETP